MCDVWCRFFYDTDCLLTNTMLRVNGLVFFEWEMKSFIRCGRVSELHIIHNMDWAVRKEVEAHRIFCTVVYWFTLPETNSSHLKMDGWNTTFLLGWPIFRGHGHVSFRGGYQWLCNSQDIAIVLNCFGCLGPQLCSNHPHPEPSGEPELTSLFVYEWSYAMGKMINLGPGKMSL